MQAIEFEAIADQHMLRLPDQVPNGVRLRVLLLLDDTITEASRQRPENQPRRKPSPKLAGSVVMHDDLITPAVPAEDWDTLK
jgi:hypothetical protein